MSRKDERLADEERIARIYAGMLRDGKPHNWREMNEAILDGRSMTALERIKRRAWDLAK